MFMYHIPVIPVRILVKRKYPSRTQIIKNDSKLETRRHEDRHIDRWKEVKIVKLN